MSRRQTWSQTMRDLADWLDRKADKIAANGNPVRAEAERRRAEEWRTGPGVLGSTSGHEPNATNVAGRHSPEESTTPKHEAP